VARGLAVPEGVTVSGIEDLAGQTVITTKGATADVDLLARIAQSGVDVRVEYVDGQDIGAQRVVDGDAIAFAEGVGSIETLARDFPGLQLAWEHCLMLPDGTISSEPFGFVVRTASSGLLPALNSFIADSGVAYPGGPGSGRDCPSGE
jgi:ABC-type amino acid transport substrate-binding protein